MTSYTALLRNKERTRAARMLAPLCLCTGLFYLLSGLWPIIHMDSFVWVTGPKTDGWLVRTVGAILMTNGLVLLSSWARAAYSLETALLAVGTSLTLATIDMVYVANGTISNVYLYDAAVELLLVLFWVISLRSTGLTRRA